MLCAAAGPAGYSRTRQFCRMLRGPKQRRALESSSSTHVKRSDGLLSSFRPDSGAIRTRSIWRRRP
uniref:Uncharacterized protein n=1 Tax=Arundo donax TaxID=35708 RepID=A0A0A8ZBR9_ARUDO